MAGKGEGNVTSLDKHISLLKNLLFFTNIIIWMLAVAIIALCMWLRFEPGLEEWLTKLELTDFYIGIYVLICGGVIMVIVSFIGCFSALNEHTFLLTVFIGTQVLAFIFGLAGSAVLLDNSTQDSKIAPLIRESMRRLIMNSHHDLSRQTLAMVQENIGCCGADGPNDYLSLRQPLPTQCRDTVTGNTFFHGCVEELIWFFEEKAGWITGLAMTVCLVHVCNVVMSIVLIQAIKKEENRNE